MIEIEDFSLVLNLILDQLVLITLLILSHCPEGVNYEIGLWLTISYFLPYRLLIVHFVNLLTIGSDRYDVSF